MAESAATLTTACCGEAGRATRSAPRRHWTRPVLASLLATILSILVSGCEAPAPQLSPLELQSIQSREIEADKDVVFNAVVSVFQDKGYTIESADRETGFITAKGTRQVITPSFGEAFLLSLVGVHPSAANSMAHIKATAFVEAFTENGGSRLRLNFVNVDALQGDTPVHDAQIYTNAFDLIADAIFIRE